MSDPETGLPAEVWRPLSWAAGVLALCALSLGAWAIWAEISTTLRVPGVVSTEALSHTLQHPTGGRLAAVHVSLHQRVQAGDVLFEFDTRDLALRLRGQAKRAEFMRRELAQIAPRLESKGTRAPNDPSVDGGPVSDAFRLRDLTLLTRLREQQDQARVATIRRQLLEQERLSLARQHDLLSDRLAKRSTLAAKGIVAAREVEDLQQQALDLQAQLPQLDGQIAAAQYEIEAADLKSKLMRREYRQQLAELRAAHLRDLEELDASIARLQQTIDDAVVYSPIAGTITDLPVDTFDRVARGGETLAVISQPLAEPLVDLHVPASYVDQVRAGQQGVLTISSLPQRGLPEIKVIIEAVAGEPVRDPSGQTLHYRAAGRLDPEDLMRARQQLGARFNLTLGMPVSAALVGPPTTLWTYLTEPITSMWQTAFES